MYLKKIYKMLIVMTCKVISMIIDRWILFLIIFGNKLISTRQDCKILKWINI